MEIRTIYSTKQIKTIKRLLSTILILLTVVFQSKSQDVVVESNNQITHRKNSSSPAFVTLDKDKGRIIFQLRPLMKTLLDLNAEDLLGIMGNTVGGSLEVRVYAYENYNFNHKRENPNLLMGFYSTGNPEYKYEHTGWIVKEYWPWYCLGGTNYFCLQGSTSYVTLSSDNIDQFKKNAIRQYNKKFKEYLLDDAFHVFNDGTLDMIVEVDYDLPGNYEDFLYKLMLPGYTEINQDEIILREQLFANTDGLRKPLFSSVYHKLRNMITSEYNTSLIDMEYLGKHNTIVPNAHTFRATYGGNQHVNIRIIEQDPNEYLQIEAEGIAEDIAISVGQLPKVSRSTLWNVHVYRDIVRANVASLVSPTHTVNAAVDYQKSVLLSCTSALAFDSQNNSKAWNNAVNLDPTYISYFSREFHRWDHSESFIAWLKIRLFNDRNNEINIGIEEAIPNRIDYFDNLITDADLYPSSEYSDLNGRVPAEKLVSILKEEVHLENLKIYPNPTNRGNAVLILNTYKVGELNIEIIDLQGKVIKSQKMHIKKGRSEIALDLRGFSIGLYTIKVRGAGIDRNEKLLVSD
jgi:hypothetical protein